jgi:osmotically-inducible protein OsmY
MRELSDTEIADAATTVLRRLVVTAAGHVNITVHEGWVTLSGEVAWRFQRNAAERVVRNVIGVKGITNDVTVAARIKPAEVKLQIENAFKRQPLLDATEIQIDVARATVTLKGRVRTWQELENASMAAWSAPGITYVDNRILVH